MTTEFAPPEAALRNFGAIDPFFEGDSKLNSANNANNISMWPTLNNVKNFWQHYANVGLKS